MLSRIKNILKFPFFAFSFVFRFLIPSRAPRLQGKDLPIPLESIGNKDVVSMIVKELERFEGDAEAKFQVITMRKKKMVRMPDWGTVIIGFDLVAPEFREEVLSLAEGSSFIFFGEVNMDLPKILAKLGAFPSASRARKSGWNKKINAGCSEHQFKVKGVMGELMIISIPGSDWELKE